MKKTITYAQNKEDLILSGFFEPDEKGFYVDVGANSPEADTVTKLFYDRGWHGINIEPIKSHFKQIKKLRPRDSNLNIGISSKPGRLKLREYEGNGLSTFSEAMKKAYAAKPNIFTQDFIDYEVETKTLKQVLSEQKVSHISFLKVDVEGFEYEVLESNDWKKFRPEVICIEANHIEKDWRPLLEKSDYVLVFFDGLNNYYVDKFKPERQKKFSYVQAVIFKEPIVSYLLLPEFEKYEQLQAEIKKNKRELELKNQQIAYLEAILGEVTPLRRHFKRQVKAKLSGVHHRIINKLQKQNQFQPSDVAHDASLEALHEADKQNFENFNQARQDTAALKAYKKASSLLFKAAGKVARIGKM